MSEELQGLSAWLKDYGVTTVAMESTGVYWKPVYNLLEGQFDTLVVNAQHIKQLVGRKTDVADAARVVERELHFIGSATRTSRFDALSHQARG